MMGEGGARASSPEAPAVGRILAGRYQIGKLLRTGGMGSVYEGEHMGTGRRVALKLVHLRSPEISEVEGRFEREARIASNVQSKHIVQVFDAGRDPVLGPFIAMELLKGEDLEDHLARSGNLSPRVACEIAYQAARGLEKAHAASVAHRDLKPGNVFLVDSDEEAFLVKVLDFGIAKLIEEEDNPNGHGNAKLTRDGSALGTPLYMSPEQARGCVDIDGRTDIYSLGAVLYEMIVGRPHVPELPNFNQLVIHIATVPAPRISVSVPDIDPRIDRLVADMLVSDRRDRLRTMRAVRERVAAILGSGARAPSLSDGSGSFAARAAASAFARSGEVSSSAIRAAPPSACDDDGEEVLFFDRGSLPSEPAAVAAAEMFDSTEISDFADIPDSGSESIALFDRASLRLSAALPAANERTSSGAHVVDARRAPSPVPLRPEPATRPAAARPPPTATRGARQVRGLIAAGVTVAAFVALGSVRLVMSREGKTAAVPASVAPGGPAVAAEQTVVATPTIEPPRAPVGAPEVPDAGLVVPPGR